VFKIEGRARGPEYVYTVVSVYKEAIRAVINSHQQPSATTPNATPQSPLAPLFTEEQKDQWDARLATVFNRGFWDGYYQGQRLGEWNSNYGSNATEKKQLVGKVVKFYSRLSVAEVSVEASEFSVGDRLLITGPTTGALWLDADEIRYELQPVSTAHQRQHVSIPVPEKVRPGDKLFKLISVAQQTTLHSCNNKLKVSCKQ
ncbi:MAG: U32 family peptidase, partial [Prevotella sp.]|nr:U32 family peptidase [Prevotella sp.]